ncbi:MAG: hypothetical protein E8D47_05175 [Nitrospira sp.]|nr:MAG: hypothetical protein E8D47_05175 [Nitrospira sp.]
MSLGQGLRCCRRVAIASFREPMIGLMGIRKIRTQKVPESVLLSKVHFEDFDSEPTSFGPSHLRFHHEQRVFVRQLRSPLESILNVAHSENKLSWQLGMGG